MCFTEAGKHGKIAPVRCILFLEIRVEFEHHKLNSLHLHCPVANISQPQNNKNDWMLWNELMIVATWSKFVMLLFWQRKASQLCLYFVLREAQFCTFQGENSGNRPKENVCESNCNWHILTLLHDIFNYRWLSAICGSNVSFCWCSADYFKSSITRLLHHYQTGFPFPRFCCSVVGFCSSAAVVRSSC